MIDGSPTTATPQRPRVVVGLRLVRLVGSGGEGEVWEARDERGQQRALKLIRPDALADDAEARSFHLLQIDHPALVRVYRGGRLHDGDLAGWGFLEMDFVDGPSLHEAEPDPAVLDRLWSLAEGLDLLHAGEWTEGLPLVHRDVKPANLVEGPDGTIVLVDPSTLRGIDANTLTRVGTPVFSAPEVMTGRFGPAADVYSFAVTVVALLTGARGEQLARVLDEAHTLDLPRGVSDALSASPKDRPATCSAVLEAGAELADDPTIFLPALHNDDAAPRWYGDTDDDAEYAAYAEDAAPAPRPRRLWAWASIFLMLVAALGVAAVTDLITGDLAIAVGTGAVVVHLLATALARGSVALAVLLPPVSWAVLLGRRVSGNARRRAWASAALIGAMAPVVAGGVAATLGGWVDGRAAVGAGAGGTAVLVTVTLAAMESTGGWGVVLRLLLVPLWAVGAAVLVAGGAVLTALGLTHGVAWVTLTSLAEGLRRPAMMRPSSDPTWRE